jgi:predicted site-specific integrase-resolvase
MLATLEQENQALSDDKIDLQRQVADVESICHRQLVESQQQNHKAKQSLKDVISKQSEDRKIILEVIQD